MSPSIRAALGTSVVVAALAAALTGCAPEESAGSASATPSPTSSDAPAPEQTSVPLPTPEEGPEVALPADCAGIYSAEMFASLEQQNPPLNDPGVTMLATENAALLEMLETVPTLRCSWGQPSDFGLATNVSVLEEGQAGDVTDELAQAGFGCADEAGALICRTEQRGVTLEDEVYTRGETHAVRGNLWIATSWLNFTPEGYTEDILATLSE